MCLSVCSDWYLLSKALLKANIMYVGGAWHEEENGEVVGPLGVDQGQVSVPQVTLQGQGCLHYYGMSICAEIQISRKREREA